jgi:hypothetical protein
MYNKKEKIKKLKDTGLRVVANNLGHTRRHELVLQVFFFYWQALLGKGARQCICLAVLLPFTFTVFV